MPLEHQVLLKQAELVVQVVAQVQQVLLVLVGLLVLQEQAKHQVQAVVQDLQVHQEL